MVRIINSISKAIFSSISGMYWLYIIVCINVYYFLTIMPYFERNELYISEI